MNDVQKAVVTIPTAQLASLIVTLHAAGCDIVFLAQTPDPAAMFPGLKRAYTKRDPAKKKRGAWTKARRIAHGKQVSARHAANRAAKEAAYRKAKRGKKA